MNQFLVSNRHLLLLTIPFIILPTKAQVRELVEALAARQQDPVVQWIAIIFFASIPLFIVATPCYQLIKLQLDISKTGRTGFWPGVTGVLFLLLTIVYTIVRVLYWIS